MSLSILTNISAMNTQQNLLNSSNAVSKWMARLLRACASTAPPMSRWLRDLAGPDLSGQRPEPGEQQHQRRHFDGADRVKFTE